MLRWSFCFVRSLSRGVACRRFSRMASVSHSQAQKWCWVRTLISALQAYAFPFICRCGFHMLWFQIFLCVRALNSALQAYALFVIVGVASTCSAYKTLRFAFEFRKSNLRFAFEICPGGPGLRWRVQRRHRKPRAKQGRGRSRVRSRSPRCQD